MTHRISVIWCGAALGLLVLAGCAGGKPTSKKPVVTSAAVAPSSPAAPTPAPASPVPTPAPTPQAAAPAAPVAAVTAAPAAPAPVAVVAPAPVVVPAPKVPEATSTAPEVYTVQPEDVLSVAVYQEPDLTTKARVSGAYEIMVPLLGRIPVAGLTVAQIQEQLLQRYAADYLVNPQVSVSVDSYHARNVFVTGAVKRPGSYAIPIEKPTTVMEVLSMAGGFSETAAVNSTRIIRTERGVERTVEVKAGDIVKKGDKAQDVAVRPNDIIFVPESFF
jgi:polysaccharide export outer membrane protein